MVCTFTGYAVLAGVLPPLFGDMFSRFSKMGYSPSGMGGAVGVVGALIGCSLTGSSFSISSTAISLVTSRYVYMRRYKNHRLEHITTATHGVRYPG